MVEADGDDFVHSDGKTAKKAVDLIQRYKGMYKPFFLAVGFVYPMCRSSRLGNTLHSTMRTRSCSHLRSLAILTTSCRPRGNRRTSANLQMGIGQQKRLVRGYYASVSYMDAMTGMVLQALEDSGQRDNTIVVFTSDHGYHLGEHDLWSKVSIHEESAKVPLVISVPGGLRRSAILSLV